MFGLAAVLFFSVTGLTLNHPGLVLAAGAPRLGPRARCRPTWLRLDAPAGSPADEADDRGRSRSWRSSNSCGRRTASAAPWPSSAPTTGSAPSPSRAPGYAADAFIDRESGRYDLTETLHGFVAVINDLHKGRDTGRAWSVVIDASAIVLILISLTGLVLLFYLKRQADPRAARGRGRHGCRRGGRHALRPERRAGPRRMIEPRASEARSAATMVDLDLATHRRIPFTYESCGPT